MSLQIRVLDLGDVVFERSFRVWGQGFGESVQIPSLGYLILGGDDPIVVDTGYVAPAALEAIGLQAPQTPEQGLAHQLSLHGVRPSDVRYVVHTHLHIDHAGQDHLFPMSTSVVVNRREMELSVSGLPGYFKADIQHLVERLYTPGALALFDLELSGPDELVPGVTLQFSGGHTEGSINVLVETAEGVACICGDIVYDAYHQLVQPHLQLHALAHATTGNHLSVPWRAERAAMRRALNSGDFLLFGHDRPIMLSGTRPVGRLHDRVPGPVEEIVDPHSYGLPGGVDPVVSAA
jgi:glyoxylase-like metal-dependent hydrolase (beta-lactamase superfamily II)